MAVEINVNLAKTEGDQRGGGIAETMATELMEDMSAHLLPQQFSWFRDGRTWSMIQEEKEVRSQTDYILGVDLRLFGNVSIRYPRHIPDPDIDLGCIYSASLRNHARYLEGSKRLPLCPPITPTREDRIFAALRRAVPKRGSCRRA